LQFEISKVELDPERMGNFKILHLGPNLTSPNIYI
jgi:hypothetical protein